MVVKKEDCWATCNHQSLLIPSPKNILTLSPYLSRTAPPQSKHSHLSPGQLEQSPPGLPALHSHSPVLGGEGVVAICVVKTNISCRTVQLWYSMAVRQPGGQAPLQLDALLCSSMLCSGLLCAVLACSSLLQGAGLTSLWWKGKVYSYSGVFEKCTAECHCSVTSDYP